MGGSQGLCLGSFRDARWKIFFPALIIRWIFLLPTTTVGISDKITNTYRPVGNVPLLLALVARTASSIGNSATEAIEAVLTSANDPKYTATGMVFGADNVLDMSKYVIRNGDFARNLREFSKQCVFYDLLHGKYTLSTMQKSTDLWGLFKSHTSSVRMINYTDPNTGESSLITCQAAVKTMEPFLEKEKKYHLSQEIGKHLQTTFQSLTSMSKDAGELINQQIMMGFFSGGFDAQGFATRRAQTQQLSTYQTIGSLASSGIITTRVVIEALVYISFIFVLPMSLLPMGTRFLSTWLWLVIWIQLWPPFFSILSCIMQWSADGSAGQIFAGLLASEKGLSMTTSLGLFDLHQNIAANAGFLSSFVPILSYAITQGGVSSFVHLTSSMISPAHSAAGSAAAEQVTGNYSFANTSVGGESFSNSSVLQHSLAPSLSMGYMRQNDGSFGITIGPDGHRINQELPNLATNILNDRHLSESLGRSKQSATSHANTTQQGLSTSLSNQARDLGDLANYFSKSENVSDNMTGRSGVSVQESAAFVKSQAKSLQQHYGISERDSLDLILRSVGENVFGGVSFSDSNVTDEAWQEAKNIASNDTFQKHYQNLNDFSKSQSFGQLNDDGRRFTENYSRSFDNVTSAQSLHQDALTKVQQVSDTLAYSDTLSISMKQDMSREFQKWAAEKYADVGGMWAIKDIFNRGEASEIDSLVQEFMYLKAPHVEAHSINPEMINPESSYNDSAAAFEKERNKISSDFIMDEKLVGAKNELHKDFIDRKEQYTNSFEGQENAINGHIQSANEQISANYMQSETEIKNKQGEYTYYKKAKETRNAAGNFGKNALDVARYSMGLSSIPISLWYKDKQTSVKPPETTTKISPQKEVEIIRNLG